MERALPIDYGGREKTKNTQNHALAPKWTRVLRASTPEYSARTDAHRETLQDATRDAPNAIPDGANGLQMGPAILSASSVHSARE